MLSVLSRPNHVISLEILIPQGVMPDPKKVDVIKRIQAPQTKQELQSFLGMVNYLCKFIKDISQLTP